MSLNEKTVFGVGYFGIGKYKSRINGIKTESYKTWYRMLRRAYSEELHSRQPYYKNTKVCEEWHNFQNFAKWYEENYYQIDDETMHLDKDIIKKNNNLYSPETCIFVNKQINTLFTKRQNFRGKFLIGVSILNSGRYRATLTMDSKAHHIGVFDTEKEAYFAYKYVKEKEIKRIADMYKDKIPQRLYEALYNYTVDIED